MDKDLQKMLDSFARYHGVGQVELHGPDLVPDMRAIGTRGLMHVRPVADREYEDALAFIAEMVAAGELDPLDGVDFCSPL